MSIIKYFLIFIVTIVITVLVITLTPLKKYIINGDAQPPSEAPLLASPINQADKQLFTLTLSWKPVPGATFYLLCIRDAVTNNIIFNRTTKSTTFTIPENVLTETKKYNWVVAGGNSAGNGPFSEPWYFTTLPPYVNFLVQDESGRYLEGIKVKLFGEDTQYSIYAEQEKISDTTGFISFNNFRLKTAVFFDPSEKHYPFIFSLEERSSRSKTYKIKLNKLLKSTVSRTRELVKSNIDADDLEIFGWRTVRSYISPINDFVDKKDDQISSITQILNQTKEVDSILNYILVVGPVSPAKELAIKYRTTPSSFIVVGSGISVAERLLAEHIYDLIYKEITKKSLNIPGSKLFISLMNYKQTKLLILKWWYTI